MVTNVLIPIWKLFIECSVCDIKATAVISVFMFWMNNSKCPWKRHSSLAQSYYLWQGDYVFDSIGLSVCLFVCQPHYSKSYELIPMTLYSRDRGSKRHKWLNFGGDPNHDPVLVEIWGGQKDAHHGICQHWCMQGWNAVPRQKHHIPAGHTESNCKSQAPNKKGMTCLNLM